MLNYLNNKLIIFENKELNKQDIIDKMINLVSENTKYVNSRDGFLEKIMERENIGTTGIGMGIVIPHARCEYLDEIVIAMAVLKHPIEFNTPDGELAKIVVLLGSPKGRNSEYLKLLSKITAIFRNRDFRENILKIENQEELVEIMAGLEV